MGNLISGILSRLASFATWLGLVKTLKEGDDGGDDQTRELWEEDDDGFSVQPREWEVWSGGGVQPREWKVVNGSGVQPREWEVVNGSGVQPREWEVGSGSGVQTREWELPRCECDIQSGVVCELHRVVVNNEREVRGRQGEEIIDIPMQGVANGDGQREMGEHCRTDRRSER
ncbi:hypothetical protein Pmani_024692 [Petrolisthes manimaculis]|uniref:Uncharacterized protein n=1 Tax=Petrolisthes manimaculis TaxID=1843537 RepID=A0AAE1P865_9EUCA|nr:hypothetical protein Pmani_024692 [Petrolisthes manimaculis]